jgi:2-polyprenyl-3-methyl-5-hydroxy-6-metoxy-1,4-benzoquinol methylase
MEIIKTGGISTDPVYKLREISLLKFLKKKTLRTEKLLDLGCDTGDTSKVLNKIGFNVTSVDIDEERVEELSKLQGNITFLQQNLEQKFKFEDESFDIIWAGDIIEHLIKTENFVKECFRVLKKGGYFIISTPYHGFIKNLLIISMNFDQHFNPWDEHIRFYTIKSLKQQLKRNKFKVIKIELLGRIKPIAKNMMFFCKKE